LRHVASVPAQLDGTLARFEPIFKENKMNFEIYFPTPLRFSVGALPQSISDVISERQHLTQTQKCFGFRSLRQIYEQLLLLADLNVRQMNVGFCHG
jgi:hypothetical protein